MTRDAAVPPAGAGVTFVMPVLNERDYLERAVETVLAQDFEGPRELVLALGPSHDGPSWPSASRRSIRASGWCTILPLTSRSA